jgi:hypothetical protein
MWNLCGHELHPQFDRERLAALLVRFRHVVVREQDKSLANRLEEELLRGASPAIQAKTFLRLAKWCKTDGIYQDGMGVAREISLLLFGCVLDREQLGV